MRPPWMAHAGIHPLDPPACSAILHEKIQQLPCLAPPLRRCEVLEIKNQRVGLAIEHGNVCWTVHARSENPCAAKVRIADGHLKNLVGRADGFLVTRDGDALSDHVAL